MHVHSPARRQGRPSGRAHGVPAIVQVRCRRADESAAQARRIDAWSARLARVVRAGLLLLVLGATAAHAAGVSCDGVASWLPARVAGAVTGSEFARRMASLPDHERDVAILAELLAGNLPSFLRTAVPVTLRPSRQAHQPAVTVCVLPDYLALGSDADFLRVPLSLPSAIALGRAFRFTLPTRRIVDAVWAQAGVHLEPQPLPAGDRMRSMDYLVRHNALVEAQRLKLGVSASELIAGHQKDLVATPRLWSFPPHVAIYGWHRLDGAPIQPLSTVHGPLYADYSHGVRLVADAAWLGGEPVSLARLLADPALSGLVSDEGPVGDIDQLGADVAPPAGATAVATLSSRSSGSR